MPAFVNAEQIDSYQVDVQVNRDATINVEEKILYNFGSLQRHGIFRNIPYKYRNDLGRFNLRISNIEVTDDSGRNIPFSKSTSNGDLVLKIGDADLYVTGVQEYNIRYTVDRAINFFADHDELYWNAIGTGWEVPIEQAQVLVNLPVSSIDQACYSGPQNSQSQNCTVANANSRALTFTPNQLLDPGQGLTVVVSVPAGTITQPTWQDRLGDLIKDNWILVLPVLVFGIMFLLWRKYGKDSKGRGVILAEYEPPQNLSPLYLGTLVDGRLDQKDYSAEIINFAVQGCLTIKKVETTKLLFFKGSDYELTKLKDLPNTAAPQSKKLFEALFKGSNVVKLSEFKNDIGFGQALAKIPGKVFKELTASNYYRHNPTTARVITIALGAIVIGSITVFSAPWFGALSIVAGISSGIILIVFAFLMPARTAKGAETRDHILGLKQYLSIAERDRLKFHHDPGKIDLHTPAQFEKLLPFAVALGVEKQWAKQFEGLYNDSPGWYKDTTSTGFNVGLLAGSVGDFSSSFQSAVAVTTASSGGSGFSGGGVGGGGGGGGGGSW